TFFMQPFSELQSGLSAELHDHAIGLFQFYDFPKMLPIYRLKIEFVGNIKIRGYGFGIAVDHDGFIAAIFYRHQPVGAAIIKFDTLPDAVGTGAEYDYFFLLRRDAFVMYHFLWMRRFLFEGFKKSAAK